MQKYNNIKFGFRKDPNNSCNNYYTKKDYINLGRYYPESPSRKTNYELLIDKGHSQKIHSDKVEDNIVIARKYPESPSRKTNYKSITNKVLSQEIHSGEIDHNDCNYINDIIAHNIINKKKSYLSDNKLPNINEIVKNPCDNLINVPIQLESDINSIRVENNIQKQKSSKLDKADGISQNISKVNITKNNQVKQNNCNNDVTIPILSDFSVEEFDIVKQSNHNNLNPIRLFSDVSAMSEKSEKISLGCDTTHSFYLTENEVEFLGNNNT